LRDAGRLLARVGHEHGTVLLGVGGPLRQLLALLPRPEQRRRVLLCTRDVGLVEGVDAQHHAGAAAADQHARVHEAAEHGLPDRARVVRMVHRVRGEGAEVEDVVAARFERRRHLLLQRKTGVVTAARDSHGSGVS
jgi:hypothetical protein